MILPSPPNEYQRNAELERNRALEMEDRRNRKTREDVELGKERLILTSPNGARWSVTVDNSGAISATAI